MYQLSQHSSLSPSCRDVDRPRAVICLRVWIDPNAVQLAQNVNVATTACHMYQVPSFTVDCVHVDAVAVQFLNCV
jgi:hypothetical protein